MEGKGSTLVEVLIDLDQRYPGFRFRMVNEQDGIRKHIRIYVNQNPIKNLSVSVGPQDVIHIICALSGG